MSSAQIRMYMHVCVRQRSRLSRYAGSLAVISAEYKIDVPT